MDTARIAYCKIHPGVGIARVGNSPDAYFIGPESPGIVPVPLDGRYKDDVGRVKRQAARFRIYAYAENGEVLGELGVGDAAIEWTVHLANTKADWFGFQSRFDTNPKTLRNAKIGEDERYKLRIDPGPRTIAGRNAGGDAKYRFDGGSFFDKPVPLGELRTDRDGHLLVLGGFGDSEAPAGEPIVQYANNDGWHDDTSDGPVSATVVLHAD
ncbi:MAG: Lysine-epsilon oxidase, partial [Candidatus Eremiobacteraeota bacterium]|nr:Lysine-epsilon oxidase [Candidatus Eremiobacteraeota bacterium]